MSRSQLDEPYEMRVILARAAAPELSNFAKITAVCVHLTSPSPCAKIGAGSNRLKISIG